MGLSNSTATLTTSAVAIAPSNHRRPRVPNVTIDASMPQLDRAPTGGRRVADSVDQVINGQFNIGGANTGGDVALI